MLRACRRLLTAAGVVSTSVLALLFGWAAVRRRMIAQARQRPGAPGQGSGQ